MLNAAWLRNWLYHGQHQLFGVAGLRLLLQGDPGALPYSHELTAGVDASAFLLICMAFPLIALAMTGRAALCLWNPATGQGDLRRGGGGPPGPEAPPDPPDSGQLAGVTDDDALAADLLSRHERGPGMQGRLIAAWLTPPSAGTDPGHSRRREALTWRRADVGAGVYLAAHGGAGADAPSARLGRRR